MSAFFGGIDPGRNGGIVILEKGEFPFPVLVLYQKMPVWPSGELDTKILQTWIVSRCGNQLNSLFFAIEKAQAMPGQGVSSMFRYGYSFGKVVGLVEGMDIKFDLVPPKKWKGEVLSGTKKDKEAAILFAERNSPEIWKDQKPHDGIADAYCMAYWAMQKFCGYASV